VYFVYFVVKYKKVKYKLPIKGWRKAGRIQGLMIIKKASWIVLLLLLMNAAGTYSEPSATYVGAKKCALCHSAIMDSWQNTRHAKAIESLKKSKQEALPACVKCHVTGYEQDGGFIDYELTPEMAGVQCEVCHGPGSKHVAGPIAQNIVKASGAELCRQCHTVKQDPGFDYAAKAKNVHSK
jgi:predicted CXXCH cytochrome family protein